MQRAPAHRLLAYRSVLYTLINLMPGVIGLCILPVVTHVINPHGYGLFSSFIAVTTGMLICLEYSILPRKRYVHHGSGDALSASVSSCTVIYAGLSLLALIGCYLFRTPLGESIPLAFPWIVLAIANAFIQSIMTIQLQLWQIAQFAKLYAIFKMVFTLSYTLIMLGLIYGTTLNWHGMAYAYVLASAVTLLSGMPLIRKHFHLRMHWDTTDFRQHLRDIGGLIPFRMALAIFSYGGTLIVLYAAGAEQSGLYALALQLCGAISLGSDSILSAIIPHLVAKPGSEEAFDPVMRKRYMWGYCALVAIGCLIILLIGPLILGGLFPADYSGSILFLGWLVLSRLLHGINRLIQEISFFGHRPYTGISIASLITGIIYLALTLMFVRSYGGIGGAIGMAAGHFLWLVLFIVYYMWKRPDRLAE